MAKANTDLKSRCTPRTFDGLVTCDEALVYFYEPKRKCSNTVWVTRNAIRLIIVKRTRTVMNIMYVIFFDSKGPVLQGVKCNIKIFNALEKLKKIEEDLSNPPH